MYCHCQWAQKRIQSLSWDHCPYWHHHFSLGRLWAEDPWMSDQWKLWSNFCCFKLLFDSFLCSNRKLIQLYINFKLMFNLFFYFILYSYILIKSVYFLKRCVLITWNMTDSVLGTSGRTQSLPSKYYRLVKKLGICKQNLLRVAHILNT